MPAIDPSDALEFLSREEFVTKRAVRALLEKDTAPPRFIRFYDSEDKKTWILNMHEIGAVVIDATHGRELVQMQYGAALLKFTRVSAVEIIRQLGVEPDSLVKM